MHNRINEVVTIKFFIKQIKLKDATVMWWLSIWLLGNWRVELPTILKEGLNYISENQEEKYKYAHDDFISVLFNQLK